MELPEIKIYNNLGKVISELLEIFIHKGSFIEIDPSHLSNGVYFLRTTNEMNKIIKR